MHKLLPTVSELLIWGFSDETEGTKGCYKQIEKEALVVRFLAHCTQATSQSTVRTPYRLQTLTVGSKTISRHIQGANYISVCTLKDE